MFEITYLCVLVLAALPLALTVLRGSNDPIAYVHRLYRDAGYILAAIAGIVCLEVALSISLEDYWFTELAFSRRFWLSIEYRVGILLVIVLVVGLLLAVNLSLLCRPFLLVPKAPRGSSVLRLQAWSGIWQRRFGFRFCASSA